MDCESSFGRLAKVVESVLAVDSAELFRHTTASDVNGWDSVTHIYVVLAVEEEFGVSLPLEKTVEAKDLGALFDLVVASLASSAGDKN